MTLEMLLVVPVLCVRQLLQSPIYASPPAGVLVYNIQAVLQMTTP